MNICFCSNLDYSNIKVFALKVLIFKFAEFKCLFVCVCVSVCVLVVSFVRREYTMKRERERERERERGCH